jgi:DNA-binding CsgD family transcriptional regulator
LITLTAGKRDVVLLVALGQLSHVEVAEALGISYGTVGSRLSRARKKPDLRIYLSLTGKTGQSSLKWDEPRPYPYCPNRTGYFPSFPDAVLNPC